MTLTDAELAELYARYAHVVFRRCLSILGNEEDAHDAVHDTFSKVMRAGAEFRGQSSPLTWMYRISTNHCLNVLRDRKGRQNKLTVHREDLVGDGADHPTGQVAFDHDLVRRLLEDADEETRQCVVHTYFDDCTREEVAELVGISVPTVRKRVAQFLERARRVLGVSGVAAVVALSLWIGQTLGIAP